MKIEQHFNYLKTPAGKASPVGITGQANAKASAVSAVGRKENVPPMSADFDAARVDQIRESITAGRYQVDTNKIADGLLTSVRDLLGERLS